MFVSSTNCMTLYYTILYYTTLHYTILYYNILYYTRLYYNIRYDTTLQSIVYYFVHGSDPKRFRAPRRRAPSAMFGATTTAAKPSMPCRTQVSESSKTPRQPDTISVKGVEAVKTLIKKLLWLKTRSGVSFGIPDLEASLSA